jgi:hypothetical protein
MREILDLSLARLLSQNIITVYLLENRDKNLYSSHQNVSINQVIERDNVSNTQAENGLQKQTLKVKSGKTN